MTVLVAVALTLAPIPPGPDQLPEAAKAMDQIAVYVHDAERAAIEATMADAAAQFGRWLAEITPPPVPPPRSAALPPRTGAGGGVVSGDCGGATNGADRFIQRESGGNPGIYNTGGSGAWGCYQIMAATWASSCSDLGAYGSASASVQARCASRLPLSAWGG